MATSVGGPSQEPRARPILVSSLEEASSVLPAACGSGQLWGMRFMWANNPVGSTWGCEALEDMQG